MLLNHIRVILLYLLYVLYARGKTSLPGNAGLAQPLPPGRPADSGDSVLNSMSWLVYKEVTGWPGSPEWLYLFTRTTSSSGGNRRQRTFFGDDDYSTYVELLSGLCRKAGTRVWAYCLMPNTCTGSWLAGDNYFFRWRQLEVPFPGPRYGIFDLDLSSCC